LPEVEHVEILRRAFDGWAIRDDAVVALFDENCQVRPILALVPGGVFRGHDGVRSWMREISGDWSEVRPEIESFADEGDELLVAGRVRGRARAGDVGLDVPIWLRCRFAGERIAELELFREPTEAHREAGLAGR
jgi:ketosteroid isomerase-like protein